jgi:hypothetical protein
MSHYTAISDVSETLRRLLEREIADPANVAVALNSPQRVALSTNHLLNLYLYQVVESPYAKNRPPFSTTARQTQRAPLTLSLYYMLTPYTQDTETNANEHLILGDAMRVLYDHGTIVDPWLEGSLRGSGEELHAVLCRNNLEELTRIWSALQMSYRLSVCYEVRLAQLDSYDRQDISRVESKDLGYGQL